MFHNVFVLLEFWLRSRDFLLLFCRNGIGCASMEVRGARSAAVMAHRDARSFAHSPGDGCAHCHERHRANWRATISRGSWWTPFFDCGCPVRSFVSIHQDDCRRGLAVAAPALFIFGCVARSGHRFRWGGDGQSSRRYFFHAAGVLAGAVPFVSALTALLGSGCGSRFVRSRFPSRIFRRRLTAFALRN